MTTNLWDINVCVLTRLIGLESLALNTQSLLVPY